MNIYEKLADARVRFKGVGVKKSGKNEYTNKPYFELADITPHINVLGRELGFVCLVTFTETEARLVMRDTEKDESITFTSPMSKASLKGCHEVQNLGAVQTYIKRYLYQHTFEIIEEDVLDSTVNPNTRTAPPATKPAQKQDLTPDELALEEWLNVSPPVFTHEQINTAKEAIKRHDVAVIKKALETAKAKNREV